MSLNTINFFKNVTVATTSEIVSVANSKYLQLDISGTANNFKISVYAQVVEEGDFLPLAIIGNNSFKIYNSINMNGFYRIDTSGILNIKLLLEEISNGDLTCYGEIVGDGTIVEIKPFIVTVTGPSDGGFSGYNLSITFEELRAIVDSGQEVILKYNDEYYYLLDSSNGNLSFVTIHNNYIKTLEVNYGVYDVWYRSYSVETSGNKAKNIEDYINSDFYYPTTKAVADYVGDKSVGIKIDNNAEIFNDYENNETNIPNAHVEGRDNKAVIKCFLIQSYNENTVTLDSVEGIKVGMNWNIFIPHETEGYDKYRGKVESISGNVVTLSNDINVVNLTNIEPASTGSFLNTFIVHGGTIGTALIEEDFGAFSVHLSGEETIGYINSHTEGRWTKALGYATHAEGYKTEALGERSHAEGYKAIAFGNESHAEGLQTEAKGQNSHAEGRGVKAIGLNAHAEGCSTEAHGISSHTEGLGTITGTEGEASHAEGYKAEATSFAAHAEGHSTKAIAEASHVEGLGTIASALASHAEGQHTYAQGVSSHAEGNSTKASGDNSHAEGNNTIASGSHAHAEGIKTSASGASSHAEGESTSVTAAAGHAEGEDTTVSANYGHAEGIYTTTSGRAGHAEGHTTTASGYVSHAEGAHTEATSEYTHAEGRGTIAKGRAQHVEGEYNAVDTGFVDDSERGTYAHITGGGTSDTDRRNIHTLDWNGNAWFAGKVFVGDANNPSNAKELSTCDYVDTKVAGIVETAPETLNTLNEIAKALGEDPNFATTIMNMLASKLNIDAGAENEGKVLKVVNGKATWAELDYQNAEEVVY